MDYEDSSQKVAANSTLKIAGVAFATILYVFYFVGRGYLEGYYSTLGISKGLLQFGTADYIYQGAIVERFLFSLAIVLFVCGLFRFLQLPKQETHQTNHDSIWRGMWDILKSPARVSAYFSFFFFPYYVVALVSLGVMQVLGILKEAELARAFLMLLTIVMAGGMGLITLFDETTTRLIKKSNLLSLTFVIFVILTIAFMPYFGATTYGTIVGTWVTSPLQLEQTFQTVELIAREPMNGNLRWEASEKGLYHTKDTLYLLLSKKGLLFVLPAGRNNIVVAVPIETLSSFTLHARK